MPSVATTDPSSKAGIITTSDGERHIPSSTRPDGTVRKEIRVRPGYRPPEDVEVYKNRTAEAWKTRGKGGVPGAEFVTKPSKPAKTPKKASTTEKKGNGPNEAQKGSNGVNLSAPAEVTSQPSDKIDPEVEKEKEVRKLTKKLKQARELQQKKLGGDVLLPEQFEKVIRINELIRQLDNLGFDADGQRKT